MDSISLLREQFRLARAEFNVTCQDVTLDSAHAQPSGTANSVAAAMAHTIFDADTVIHTFLKGGAPLFAGAYAGRTGVSHSQTLITPEWSRAVRFTDLGAFRTYADAVFVAGADYIASLQESDLSRMVDLSKFGFDRLGRQTIAWLLSTALIGHIHDMTGEISAAKGFQGLKGYPF